MLILSRRADESIVIGDEVVITILSVKGKQVRVGIDAPPDVSVHREEIYQRIQSVDADADTLATAPGTSAAGEQLPRDPGAASPASTSSGRAQDGVNGNVAPDGCDIDDNAGNR